MIVPAQNDTKPQGSKVAQTVRAVAAPGQPRWISDPWYGPLLQRIRKPPSIRPIYAMSLSRLGPCTATCTPGIERQTVDLAELRERRPPVL